MRIIVAKANGEVEALNLVGKCTFHEGQHQAHIETELGVDHYFNLDGTYDGWGVVAPAGLKEDEGVAFIKALSESREFLPNKRFVDVAD